MDWSKILEILMNYGALGIIAYIFLFNYSKKEKINQDNQKILMDTVLNSHAKAIEILNESLNKLTNKVNQMMELNTRNIEAITETMAKLNEKYNESTGQISNIIYDERKLSGQAFYDHSELIIRANISESINDICEEIDKNNYQNEKQIGLLKKNIERIIENRTNTIKQECSNLAFKNEMKNVFTMEVAELFNTYLQHFRREITNNISTEELKVDKNYVLIKSSIKIKIAEYLDEILKILKDVSRG